MSTTGDRSVGTTTSASGGSDVKERAAGAAHEVVDETKQQASRLADQARTEVRGQVDGQLQQLTEGLHRTGDQIAGLADDQEQPELMARVLHEVGDRMSGFADRLEREGLDGVLDDVRRFARERPVLFVAGAAGLGFVAGRFARSAAGVVSGNGGGSSSQPRRWDVGAGNGTEHEGGHRLAGAYDTELPPSTGAVTGTASPMGSPASVDPTWAPEVEPTTFPTDPGEGRR